MSETRVVYPVFGGNRGIASIWQMLAQAVTSITSYFYSGNDVPVIVATDDDTVARVVRNVSTMMRYDVTVEMHSTSDIVDRMSGVDIADTATNRADVTRYKMFAAMEAGAGYDRLIVDADTLFLDKVPWHRFSHMQLAMFRPDEWNHPLSVTVRQILYMKWMDSGASGTFADYVGRLYDAHPAWGRRIAVDGPWPNSGAMFMTDAFRTGAYMEAVRTMDIGLLRVEDEGVLFNYLNSVLPGSGMRGSDISLTSSIPLNVPVAFTDLAAMEDPLHPVCSTGERIVLAHFHRAPKPTQFSIAYDGTVCPPALHNAWFLDYSADSIASLQYGTMSGILWTYLWHYFFSMNAPMYLNGKVMPLYPAQTWRKNIDSFVETRKTWQNARKAEYG